jgi:hypothetical protein
MIKQQPIILRSKITAASNKIEEPVASSPRCKSASPAKARAKSSGRECSPKVKSPKRKFSSPRKKYIKSPKINSKRKFIIAIMIELIYYKSILNGF